MWVFLPMKRSLKASRLWLSPSLALRGPWSPRAPGNLRAGRPGSPPQPPHTERYEDAVYGRRVRVEGQDRLPAAQIFGDVDDHAVRPECHDEVPLPERER